ncbi:PREDICTED: nucleoside diphosphate-linked moiety X motif 19, mitochondrial-like [Papilio xuthus]|uniref:Nucleoside diphosphate-linked moiety X motif 19, mitochondrial-like n=1 Tax=Papilio xuthus TaxID=66420 RepID=A0AAJ6ZMT3_PAPXU|nr:PREDICTED: nucleoside diphosphate-linked moiety X motif 19, mitochondrial-like [Papilio xuthus]
MLSVAISMKIVAHSRQGFIVLKCVSFDLTRTHNASFPNSVVFPGGVCEAADGDEEWYKHLRTFGYTESDFKSFHRIGSPLTPLFENNPIQRHVALRITAIRETFEELGLLICSQSHKSERESDWASLLTDDDLKHWRDRVSKNPADLLTLCKEYKCYPDIWALQYWSNWLTPVNQPKRFDTAFFVTALENKPSINSNSEVVNVKWLTPTEILESSSKAEVILYPPQAYEFSRLAYLPDINELLTFAKERSSKGNILLYPVPIQAKDGMIQLLPGDYLYPSDVDFNTQIDPIKDKTILELRDNNQSLHRVEVTKSRREIIIQNYHPTNHITMNNLIIPFPSITA